MYVHRRTSWLFCRLLFDRQRVIAGPIAPNEGSLSAVVSYPALLTAATAPGLYNQILLKTQPLLFLNLHPRSGSASCGR
jgi:hypothetical protein